MNDTLLSILSSSVLWWKGPKMFGPHGQRSLLGAVDRLCSGKTEIERWEQGKDWRVALREAIVHYEFHLRITRVGCMIGEFNDHPLTNFVEIRKVCERATLRYNVRGQMVQGVGHHQQGCAGQLRGTG